MVRDKDDLWRNFPKKAIELDRRFATEEACRAYWIEARWDGEPACARCGSTVRVRRLRSPNEPHVGHAVGEDQEAIAGSGSGRCSKISSRRSGISAKEVQRILGLGPYETAWSWLHKFRTVLVRPDRDPNRTYPR